MAFKDDLAQNLKSIRASQHLSLTEFAQKLDIGRSTLCGLEAGNQNPTLGMVELIAERLDVPALELLSGHSVSEEPDMLGLVWAGPREMRAMPSQKRARIALQLQAMLRELNAQD